MKQLNIGIDIGATKIVIAGCFDIESKPSVILDAEENRMTTSCLAFMKNQRLLAFAAETQAYPEGVIFGRDVKLVLGEDNLPTIDPIHFPLKILKDQDLGIVFELEYNAKPITILPEQVLAELLIFLRENIDNQYPDCEIGNCVITVPFVYNEAKISAMINACVVAGFDEKQLKIISSSMAASLTYYMERYNATESKHVMIFDMGATTIDYTLVSLNGFELNVEIVNGELNFGGDLFTMRLVEHFFHTQNDSDEKQLKRKRARLRVACEKLKKILSVRDVATIEDLNLHITRDEFENMCQPIIQDFDIKIRKILSNTPEIDEFIVIGGGARIPILQEKLNVAFPKCQFLKVLNQDEAAAIGAAYYALKLNKNLKADPKLNGSNIDDRPYKLNNKRIEFMKNQVDKIIKDEKDLKRKLEILNEIKKSCYSQILIVKKKSENLSVEVEKAILEKCEETLHWISEDKQEGSISELEKILSELHSFFDNLKRKIVEINVEDLSSKRQKINPPLNEQKPIIAPIIQAPIIKISTTVKPIEQNFGYQKQFDYNNVQPSIQKPTKIVQPPKIDRKTQIQSQIDNVETLVQAKEYNTAIAAYTNIIKNLNDDLDDEEIIFTCYIKRATLYHALRQYVDALSDYDSLLQNPRLKLYHHGILSKKNDAECELVQEMVDETIQNCKTCISWKTTEPSIIDDMHKSLLNKTELKTRKYNRLLPIAWNEHAQFHYKNQDFQTSLEVALEALQKYPNQSKFYYIAAESCYNLRQFEQAKVYYQTAQSVKPDKKGEFQQAINSCDFEIWMMEIENILNTVNNYWERGQYVEARIQLNRIGNPQKLTIELRQKFLFYSARDLFQRKMLTEAHTHCNEVLHLNDRHLDARILRAEIFLAWRRFEEALQDCYLVPQDSMHARDAARIRMNVDRQLREIEQSHNGSNLMIFIIIILIAVSLSLFFFSSI